MCCVMPPASRHDINADDAVQQRGLSVVDVAQERDDRRSSDQIGRIVFHLLEFGQQRIFERFRLLEIDVQIQFGCHQFRRFIIQFGINRDHHAHAHQRTLDLSRGHARGLGQATNCARKFDSDTPFSRSCCVGATLSL